MLISSLQMENSCTTSFEYRFIQVLLFFILSTRKVSIGEFCSLIAIAVSDSSSHRHSARKATTTTPHVQRGSLSRLVINFFLVLETISYSNASSMFIRLKYMYFLAVYVVRRYVQYEIQKVSTTYSIRQVSSKYYRITNIIIELSTFYVAITISEDISIIICYNIDIDKIFEH